MTDHEKNTTALVDAALASGAPTVQDADDRLVQELVLAIRDDAPAAAPEFERRLDARVESGFAGSRPRFALPAFRRPRLAALGVAASLLLGLVVTVSVTNRDGASPTLTAPAVTGGAEDRAESAAPEQSVPEAPLDEAAPGAAREAAPGTPDGDGAGGAAGAPSAQSAPEADAGKAAGDEALPGTSVAPDTGTGIEPVPPVDPVVPGRNRNVQRSAMLTLAAPGEDLQAVADGVVAVTDRHRGFVMRSSVTSAEDGTASGYFDLRVPVRNLRPALRDLSQLAEVRARTENADDVTASFRSARTRLEELRAQRRGLLRRLARADSTREERAIRAQIRFVNQEIEAATRQLRDLRNRTSYASVAVSLLADENAEDADGGGLSDGWNDLKDNLVESGNIALRVLGVAIPLAIVGLATWLAATSVRRRRREAALDRLAPSKPAPEA